MREIRQISLCELAHLMELPQSYLGHIEHGRYRSMPCDLENLRDALELNIGEFQKLYQEAALDCLLGHGWDSRYLQFEYSSSKKTDPRSRR